MISGIVMRVLGLDPGSVHTGYGVIDQRGSSNDLLAAGRLSPPAGQPLAPRLAFLASGLGEIVERWAPDVAVLETPFHGVNVRSLIVLAQARGALLVTLASRGLPIEELTPAEVKSAVTGNGRAGKDQVARMVRMLLPSCGPLAADAADALAVALGFAARRPFVGAVAAQGAPRGRRR